MNRTQNKIRQMPIHIHRIIMPSDLFRYRMRSAERTNASSARMAFLAIK